MARRRNRKKDGKRKRTQYKMVRRQEWGAKAPRSRVQIAEPTPYSRVHHSVDHLQPQPGWTAKIFYRAACAHVRAIQRFHMETRRWDDIGYSFVAIKPLFRKILIFEGRGWGIQGAHTEGWNSTTIGICVVGNFEVERAPRRLVEGLREFFDRGVEYGHLKGPRSKHPTGDHSQAPGASTACAGRNLRAKLPEMRKPY